MTSSRPYLIRALYDWIIDNEMTPYLLVSVNTDGVDVPKEYVREGRIILNISPKATQDLMLANESVEFHARFNGVSRLLHIPTQAVMAIYARENGQGMAFNDESDGGEPPPSDSPSSKPNKKPHLKVVK
jgi:stringent starvation protein B